MIKINKKDFKSIIDDISSLMFEERKHIIDGKIKEWKSFNNRAAVVNEPPVARGPVPIDTKSNIQVSDENLPIGDKDWNPANNLELGMALKQLANTIPEEQVEWFYGRVKMLIDASMNKDDEGRMKPRVEDMV